MTDFAAAFAEIASGLGSLSPFHDGVIVDQGDPMLDAGGSIVTPGTVVNRTCTVQIDQATEAMRQAAGFADGDVRFIILSASFEGEIDTDTTVSIATGAFAGTWLVSSIQRDPVAIGYVGRGRRKA
jgi:type 1 fimbria pilin